MLLLNIYHPFRSFFRGGIPLKITCSRLQLIITPCLSSSLFCSSRHNYFREFLNSVIKTTISIVCYSSFLVTVQCQEVGKTDILSQHHVPVELPTQHILKCNILKIKQNYIIVHILGALFGFHLSCNEEQLVLIWISLAELQIKEKGYWEKERKKEKIGSLPLIQNYTLLDYRYFDIWISFF